MGLLFGVGFAALGFTGLVVRVHHYGQRPDGGERADAIVVLGARVLPRGEPSRALRGRAEVAARLYREGRAPLLLLTGGAVDGLPSEAHVARALLLEAGVPEAACVLEESSHSTHENADNSASLLSARGVKSVLIVSDDYHLYRAQAYFGAHGLTVRTVSAGRTLSDRERVYWTVREAAALIARPWNLL